MASKIETIKHSLAHIMALAIQELYPKVKFGIGPAIENGFYYDFEFASHLSPDDLPKIEKKMQELIKKDLKFSKKQISKAQAKKLFKDQPYKINLLKELTATRPLSADRGLTPVPVKIYQVGGFVDLCKGPHIKSTKEINPKAFKLTKLAGAYWQGDEKNPMLTRIYGLAFQTEKELKTHLKNLEEAEKRDHRVLGPKLGIFAISEEIGQGLPIWLPKGAIVRRIIENYLYEELTGQSYEWLYTPHIGSRKLWETSGHWNFYNENMYPPLEMGQSLEEMQKGKKIQAEEQYLLKPMNCPFHVYVYNLKIRSYKELPIKLAELGTVYRYEKSGTLHGLIRVRGFTQDDAHIICAPEQVTEEVVKLVRHAIKILKNFGFREYDIYLSTRPEKYTGTLKNWQKATKSLEYVLRKLKLNYQIDEGGGVFYGPKIDIKIKDSIGREWQCTTVQFDFNLPQRFKMVFVDKKGKKKEPFMIHRAILGSMERFMGVLIEHYGGALPLWLSPVQCWVIPVGSEHRGYAQEIAKKLTGDRPLSKLRAEAKIEAQTLSKKIREGELQKIPYLLVVGSQEMKAETVRVRQRGKGDIGEMKLDKFLEKISKEIAEKA